MYIRLEAHLENLQPESNPQRAAKKHWELTTNVYRVPELAGPEIKSTNYEINAYITADKSTEGVIYAVGEHMGGQVLFIKDGKLRYSYSTLRFVLARFRWKC